MISEIFSNEEIDLIKSSFEYVFNHIAGVDDKIDKKENAAYFTFVQNAKNLESNLAKEILTNFDIELIRSKTNHKKSNRENLKQIAKLIENRLEREEAVEFKKTLIAFGYYIASASGSFFDHKVSHDEDDALNEIGFAVGISASDIFKTGEMENILSKIK